MVKVQSSATWLSVKWMQIRNSKTNKQKSTRFFVGLIFFSLALLFALHFSMLVSNAIFFGTLPQTVYLLIIMGHLLGCAVLIAPLI